MKPEEKPLFIWMLEYGESVHDRKVSCHDMINHAVDEGLINSRTESKARVLRSLFYESFEFDMATRNRAIEVEGGDRQDTYDQITANLRAEYYFRLLEFSELQLARESARQANENSTKALKFSVAAVAISSLLAIGTTLIQVYSPITIDPAQLERIEQISLNHFQQAVTQNHNEKELKKYQ